MRPIDDLLRPWLDQLQEDTGGFELFDAHTHIGRNDPDGYKQEPEELLERLGRCDARALVFPMHEPDGYAAANDEVVGVARDSGGRLFALCRVQPRDGDAALAEARRAMDAGAAGIKLHPRAEGFTMHEPAVRGLVALAHGRQAPVLIHAGRGIPALGVDTVHLGTEFPDAKLILAHAAISDLAWLWRELPRVPNVYVDTSWWNPSDLMALFTLAPPGQVLFASDSPYGSPTVGAVQTLRAARQAGLDDAQLRGVAGEQVARLLAGETPLDLGAAPGAARPLDPLLERLVTHLCTVAAQMFRRVDHSETLALARLACGVGEDAECAPVCAAVLELLDRFEAGVAEADSDKPFPP